MASKLEELRGLLFGAEHERLEEIGSRVEHPEHRASDVAEVLPESIAVSFRRDSRLVDALREPMQQCVSESVRDNPEEYADALFPIMGPAIRRSVAEAFKGWIQQANEVMEQSLSPRGLRWRFEAWRAGVPFGQYVLQRSLLYRVEHVYLIHSASGLLVQHVHQPDVAAKDEDAVSAMFTAIQEFVKDSFTSGQAQRLTTAELGELTLWALHGPNCILVAVIQGAPPIALRAELGAVVEGIETRHSRALQAYQGDRAALDELRPELKRCLLASSREDAAASARRGFSPALVFASLAGIALVVWLGYGMWLDLRADRFAAVLDEAPGIAVTAFQREGRRVVLRGLRDPAAPSIESLALTADWRGQVDANFRPYLSLERDIVLARAAAALAPPDGVSLALDRDRLIVSGVALPVWLESARGIAVAGVASVDFSGVALDAEGLLREIRARLQAPLSVDLAYDRGRLLVSGTAPQAFHLRLAEVTNLPGVNTIDTDALGIDERVALRELAAAIAQVTLEFASAQIDADVAQATVLDGLARDLGAYGELAETLGSSPRVFLTGHSADTGTTALNINLEQGRAATVADELVARGLPVAWLVTRSQLRDALPGTRAPRVSVRVELASAAAGAQGD